MFNWIGNIGYVSSSSLVSNVGLNRAVVSNDGHCLDCGSSRSIRSHSFSIMQRLLFEYWKHGKMNLKDEKGLRAHRVHMLEYRCGSLKQNSVPILDWRKSRSRRSMDCPVTFVGGISPPFLCFDWRVRINPEVGGGMDRQLVCRWDGDASTRAYHHRCAWWKLLSSQRHPTRRALIIASSIEIRGLCSLMFF